MGDFNNLNPNLIYDFNRLVPGGLGYASFVLQQDPILYLRFQEDSGLVAEDSSGNDINSTYTSSGITFGATSPLSSDATDKAIELDGADGYITVPADPLLDTTFSTFAMDCWIKVDALPSFEQVLISRGSTVGGNNFQLSLLPDGRIKFWFNDSDAAKLAFSPSVITPGIFYYILASWDGSTNVVFLNADQGEVVANAPGAVGGSDTIQIGAYNNAQRFDGVLDEVALYGTEITIDPEKRASSTTVANQPPEITAATANGFSSSPVVVSEGEAVSFEITATDPESDTLNYSLSPDGFLPTIGPQASNTFNYQYTETGVFSPVGFVTDGTSTRSKAFPQIDVDPVAGLTAINDFYTTSFRTARNLAVLDNDSFPGGGGGSISGFTQPANGSVVISGTGETATFDYTPDNGFQGGTDTFTYTITNGAGAEETATVNVFVAEKNPPLTNLFSTTTEPDTPVTFSPQSNDTPDPTSEVLTLVAVQTPTDQGGSASIVSNQVQYTPPASFSGTDTFLYQVEDEEGLVANGNIEVLVQTLAFTAVTDSATCAYESNVTITVLANDTTPFAAPLDVTAVTQPPVGEGTVVLNGDNTVTYTADAGFAGTTSFTYTLEDGTRVDTGTVNIRVDNFAPRGPDLFVSTPLDTDLTIDVLDQFIDPEGEALSLASFTQPPSGQGTVSRQDGGTPGDLTDDTLLYEPPISFVGATSFTATVDDAFGNSTVTTVNVVVSYSLSINVTPTDLSVENEIEFEAIVEGQSGYDKSYTYFWDFGGDGTSTAQSGTYQFTGVGTYLVTCTVVDSYGQEETASTSVQVRANLPPIANNISVSLAESQTLNFDPRSNDTEPDNESFFIVSVDATSAQGGSASVNDGDLIGDPSDDFITYNHPALTPPFVDTFDYTISDINDLLATATVTVSVEENQAPTANNVFQPVIFEQAATVDVLASATDPEGDPLTVTDVDAPPVGEGTTSVAGAGPDNTILFTAGSGFLGVTTFNFTLRDSFFHTSSAQVTASVFGEFYPALVYSDEPLVFYPFNESQGIIAYDVRPLQAHGQYVGDPPRDSLGPLAKDLENAVDVDAGYVEIFTTLFSDQISDGFTLEIWVRLRYTIEGSVIPGVLDIGSAGQSFDWTLKTDVGVETLSIPNVEAGEFYHVVLSYDGAWMRTYLDSDLISAKTHTGSVILPGRITPGLGMYGLLSCLAVYDRGLDPVTITAHYQEALGPVTTYEITPQSDVTAGSEFDVRVQARDVTGKTVKTDSSTQVLMSSDDNIEFDGDGDGIFGEP